MNLVTRAQWGARAPRSASALRGPVAGIGVHWTGSGQGVFPHRACPARVRGIQAFHMDTKRWSDIAYNFVACPHGFVFEGRGWGVRSAANGTNDANDRYHAACYLGGQGDPLTAGGKAALAAVIAAAPGIEVLPHRSFKATDCPGDEIVAWLRQPITATAEPQEDDDMPPQPTDIVDEYRWPNGAVVFLQRDGGVVGPYGAPFYGSVPGLRPEHRRGFVEAGAIRPVSTRFPSMGYIIHSRTGGGVFKFNRAARKFLVS